MKHLQCQDMLLLEDDQLHGDNSVLTCRLKCTFQEIQHQTLSHTTNYPYLTTKLSSPNYKHKHPQILTCS